MTATEKRNAVTVVKSILEIDKKMELIVLLKYSRGFERIWIKKNGLSAGTGAESLGCNVDGRVQGGPELYEICSGCRKAPGTEAEM